MSTKKTSKSKTNGSKKTGVKVVLPMKHHEGSKASKAHAFVRTAANLRRDPLTLQAELVKKFKVHTNTARNWVKDFQSRPVAS